jgi:hypothetical protein
LGLGVLAGMVGAAAGDLMSKPESMSKSGSAAASSGISPPSGS